MDVIGFYILFFSIIAIISALFNKSTIPIGLILVIAGMLISFLPNFPQIDLNPKVILDIFLPLLIYKISAFSSWVDIKKNLRPIALLSVGHVIFITFLVAAVAHFIIPGFSWPLALVLGAVISPPDDVAIVSIAEKIRLPHRIVTILKGEGIFNDATALTLFRFSLLAVVTHNFSTTAIFSEFLLVIVGEIGYGLLLGNILGRIRLKITEPNLHMIFSFLTPFLAYFPAERLGGCGILATAVTGLVMEHKYLERFSPEVRLLMRSTWSTLGYILISTLFLLVGLEMPFILDRISKIPINTLTLYATLITVTVIVGRFIWVYPAAYLPRFLIPAILKKDPYPPWQHPIIISWAGMRGGISLAAALAIPDLPMPAYGIDASDLVVFLVFCVIIATLLLQGMALPLLIRMLGIIKHGQQEKYSEHVSELKARFYSAQAVLHWLANYKITAKGNEKLLREIKIQMLKYENQKKELAELVELHDKHFVHDEVKEAREAILLSTEIIEVERKMVLQLWHQEKINHALKNKLIEQLDLRYKRFMG